MSLAGKCIVVRCFVCRDYNTFRMETEKTFVWCWQSAWIFKFYLLERRHSNWSFFIFEFVFRWLPSDVLFTCIHYYADVLVQWVFGICSNVISLLYYVLYIKINWHYNATWSVHKLQMKAVASERLSVKEPMIIDLKQDKISNVINGMYIKHSPECWYFCRTGLRHCILRRKRVMYKQLRSLLMPAHL